jgi:hypothetical protein
MRCVLCVLLLGGSLLAEGPSSVAQNSPVKGSFYVDGIVYQYVAGADYTVVAAAHSVINHKFLAVKVRVYNTGQHSVTVKPEDVVVEDAVAGHSVASISAAELAKRMRRPQNMARYTVGAVAGDSTDSPVTSDMVTPQFLEMMRAMTARTNGGGSFLSGRNLLYTDTPGALDGRDAASPAASECDEVCRLRMREAQGVDVLAQLQRSSSPDYVEQCGFLANTIPPHANVGGVFYYPLSKLAEVQGESKKSKNRLARVTVPVGGESFQFELPAE